MLFTEPMVTAIATYASFVYGLLFMTLEVFPIVFSEHRHWKTVVSTLPFLGLFVGVLSAVGLNLANQPRYRRISDAAGGRSVPEARLAPMALGGIIFAIGLFWFGWTTGNNIHCKLCPSLFYSSTFLFAILIVTPRDPPRPRNWLHRRRLQHHLPAMHQLPHRHVRPVRRQRCGGQHHPEEYNSSCVAFGREAHVPQSRYRTVNVDLGWCGCACYTGAVCVYAVWSDTEEDVEVCAGA